MQHEYALLHNKNSQSQNVITVCGLNQQKWHFVEHFETLGPFFVENEHDTK